MAGHDFPKSAGSILQEFRENAERAIEQLRMTGIDVERLAEVRRTYQRAEAELRTLIVDLHEPAGKAN